MMITTYHLQKILQTTKAPIRYLSQISWVSMPTLKAIKLGAKDKIHEKQYNMFVSWYEKYLEENKKAREELLSYVNK